MVTLTSGQSSCTARAMTCARVVADQLVGLIFVFACVWMAMSASGFDRPLQGPNARRSRWPRSPFWRGFRDIGGDFGGGDACVVVACIAIGKGQGDLAIMASSSSVWRLRKRPVAGYGSACFAQSLPYGQEGLWPCGGKRADSSTFTSASEAHAPAAIPSPSSPKRAITSAPMNEPRAAPM